MTIQNITIQFVPKPTQYNFKDLEGVTFGRWKVLGYAGTDNLSKALWFCQCECGQVRKISGDSLRCGSSKSCGCFASEARKARILHGETKERKTSPEFRAFSGAKTRCQNPNQKYYADYGGRGIEFRFNSFDEFFAEVGRKPTPKHSIERINTNGHYEKGNVKWATKIEQARNKRNNRLITIGDETKCVTQWAEKFNIPAMRLELRVNRGNYCDECAVLLPLRQRCPHKS